MMHRTRKENDMNRDKWVAVGGRFEDGESPEGCALREVKEETGLTMTDPCYRGVVTFISDVYETERMHLFTCEHWTGEMTDCDEGELVWLPKAELDGLMKERSEKAGAISKSNPRFLLYYERQRTKRWPVVVTLNHDGVCDGCHMKQPPFVEQLVQHNKDLVACTMCGRILYRDL